VGIAHVSSCAQGGNESNGTDMIRKCLVKASFTHCARQQGAQAQESGKGNSGIKGQGKGNTSSNAGGAFAYQTIVGRQSDCRIHPSSVLFNRSSRGGGSGASAQGQPPVVVSANGLARTRTFCGT